MQSISGCHPWRSVFGALSPLRAQLLGFACSRNYLEPLETANYFLHHKKKLPRASLLC